MKAIITLDQVDEGYRFTVASEGLIVIQGVANSFGQAWEFCSVWAEGESDE